MQGYWDRFYQDFPVSLYSPFCSYVLNEGWLGIVPNKQHNLLELGCGNGRDIPSLSWATNVIACDNSDTALASPLVQKYAGKIIKCNLASEFPALDGVSVDFIYSRFFLHCFPATRQREILNWAILTSKIGCFFEVRAFDPGPPCNYTYGEHSRYLVKVEDLVNVLSCFSGLNYQLIQSRGLAKFKEEDPLIIRLIIWKNY